MPFLPSGSPRIVYKGSVANDSWALEHQKAIDARAIKYSKSDYDTMAVHPGYQFQHLFLDNPKRRMAQQALVERAELDNRILQRRVYEQTSHYVAEPNIYGPRRARYDAKRRQMRLEAIEMENGLMFNRLLQAVKLTNIRKRGQLEKPDHDGRLELICEHPCFLSRSSSRASTAAGAESGKLQKPHTGTRPEWWPPTLL